mmetsp:Transcript_24069/g.40916  ORF Transcript_24069/g.40916 Transcript_24069/m.40916 type:complete len:304 (-) Transcript_24069:41-952(-)|eukprot:CAMPEP_0114413286 /NCGR_PEP_ID=MMETSP0103-20121206/775_1 /TAXON_ID=37642 ORGANISM="Paraphysomonas imperforata, Strain PA2" /NCGR_SAMPLE_ID=MMETSP0103 /ASSEMBLY_ACC=CAM_ASM_000201 /LENGTH=303 /DNA_ID=CAMNT_0001581353 /DNA_START=22 /DNA_END=933 /DNA_ORIENTATION=-
MGKSKSQKQQKSQKKVQQYLKKKGYKEKVVISQQEINQSIKKSKSPSQNKSHHQSPSSASSSTGGKGKGLSNLQQSFQKKLEGARFRVINERLYTCPGSEAFEEFQKNKSLFRVYHEGYREQTLSWPSNPLDHIITWIKQRHQGAVIADFGCGDARLAKTLNNKHSVHSFDLVSVNSLVTACDIAHVPLANNSVDVVVFCLSLMGTNIGDFLREANRVLKVGGHIKIAEVRSRFQDKNEENMKEKEKQGFKMFLNVLKEAGFKIIHKDFSNTMFLLLEGVKMDREIGEIDETYSIKPCLYKKR